jgi:hypothetical protein
MSYISRDYIKTYQIISNNITLNEDLFICFCEPCQLDFLNKSIQYSVYAH